MFEISNSAQPLVVFGILIAAFTAIIFLLPDRRRAAVPYERLPSVLSPAEQRFYHVLSSVVRDKAIIMAKIRIADLLRVKRSMKQKHFWFYFSKISQKHIDFILINPITFKTICLIELDDKSHLQFSRSKRDQFINRVMEQTGIPLYRFRVQRRYNCSDISQVLSSCLNTSV